MRPHLRGFVLLLGALVSAAGCGGMTSTRHSSATAEALPAPTPTPEPQAETPPVPRAEAPLAPQNPAVVALLGSAADKDRDGRLDEAAATLERALRIDPRDAAIWARLADVRLRQEQYRQAEALGLKAAGLAAGREPELQARCYRVVAAARRGLGDAAGAREAEARAEAALR